MNSYSKSKEQLLKLYNVDPKIGLSSVQVEKQLNQFGQNKLKEQKKKSGFVKFLERVRNEAIVPSVNILSPPSAKFGTP